MATKCFSVVRGKRVRVTRLDECGNPYSDPCGFMVTKGFVSVAFTAEMEDEEEIQVKNANGEICVLDTTCSSLKYYTLEIEFCDVDPDLFSLMGGLDTVLDWNGDTVGFQVGEGVACEEGFALELWSGIPGECTPEGVSYGYFLVPWLVNGVLGDFTIENDASTFSMSARSKKGHGWGVGPYDVVIHEDAVTAGTPGAPGPLLLPLPTSKHLHMQTTTVAPPEPVCGCQALTIPATVATGTSFREEQYSEEGGSGGVATLTRTSQTVEEPNKSAKKDEWVKFAVSRGMDKEDAKKATQDELIAKYASE